VALREVCTNIDPSFRESAEMAYIHSNGKPMPPVAPRDGGRRRRSRASAEARAPLELLSSPPDQASLAALIESQVIPRLLMAHPVRARATSAATTASGAPGIMPADIDAFTPPGPPGRG
jgi:hypothetical protein